MSKHLVVGITKCYLVSSIAWLELTFTDPLITFDLTDLLLKIGSHPLKYCSLYKMNVYLNFYVILCILKIELYVIKT